MFIYQSLCEPLIYADNRVWGKESRKTRFQTVRSYFSNVLLIFCYLKLPSNYTQQIQFVEQTSFIQAGYILGAIRCFCLFVKLYYFLNTEHSLWLFIYLLKNWIICAMGFLQSQFLIAPLWCGSMCSSFPHIFYALVVSEIQV